MEANSFNEKNKVHKCDLRLKSSEKGLCSVCHKPPQHSRTYYGQLFCINCFQKYIWSPVKDPSTTTNINEISTTSKLNVQ